MTYALMLAQPSGRQPEAEIRRLQSSGDWTFEFKYDGIRALVILDYGTVQILNRNGRDITYRYPDVVAPLEQLQIHAVLDGEIVCLDPQGRPDFSRIHRRDAQTLAKSAAALAAPMPATFVAFDILESGGVDNRLMPYRQRRLYLEDKAELLAGAAVVIPPVSADGATMWAVVKDMNLEGLVAKRNESRYVGRRSGAWVKLKRVHRLSALVTGFDRGEGRRAATFGALHLVLVDENGAQRSIGSVGTGFTEADCRLIAARLKAGDHPIIVDVEYLELSSGDQLRFPSFKGVRGDLEAADCSTEQLKIHPLG